MNTHIIGTDNWNCDGFVLTPRMRRDILCVVAEQCDDWSLRGMSFRWDEAERELIGGEPNPVVTVKDLFGEISGPRNWHFPFNFQYINDDFEEWLRGYLREVWDVAQHEERDDEDADPVHDAVIKTFGWLDCLLINDVLAWRKAECPGQEDDTVEELERLMAGP